MASKYFESRLPPGGGDLVRRLRALPDESFLAVEIAGPFELLKMQSERAIADDKPLLQRREIQGTVDLQGRQHAESYRAVDGRIQAVEVNGRHARSGRSVAKP